MDRGVAVLAQASKLLQDLTAVLQGRSKQVFRDWPIGRYMACLDDYPETAALGYRSRDVQRACKEIVILVGHDGLELYHRAVLLGLIGRAIPELPQRDLPEDIVLLFEQNFLRIVRAIESTAGEPNLYRYPLSPFCKDLAICALRLIPTGVAKVHASRLPRSMFFAGGLRSGLDALLYVLRDSRGLGPYYYAHVHSQDEQAMKEFDRQGWVASFLRQAELLRRNPNVKGHMGVGWLADPALSRISPRLAYLRDIPVAHGAGSFCLGRCGADGIRDATVKSPTRRRLYEQGDYVPMDYVTVWPRTEMIAWADSAPEIQVDDGSASF